MAAIQLIYSFVSAWRSHYQVYFSRDHRYGYAGSSQGVAKTIIKAAVSFADGVTSSKPVSSVTIKFS
jgi:hypothetical protein